MKSKHVQGTFLSLAFALSGCSANHSALQLNNSTSDGSSAGTVTASASSHVSSAAASQSAVPSAATTPSSPTAQPATPTPPEASSPNSSLLQTMEIDLKGDGHKQKLDLYVDMDENSNPLKWRLLLGGSEVVPPIGPVEESLYGPQARMETTDLNGDGKPEVLVYRLSTGTGGATGLRVYDPQSKWAVLFALDQPFADSSQLPESHGRFETMYDGKLTIQFADRKTGLQAALPYDKARYSEMDADQVSKWLKNMRPWVDPVYAYNIVDGAGGTKEIVSEQRIIGFSHPDTLAQLEVHYRLSGGKFVPYKQEVKSVKGEVLGECVFK